MSAESKPQTHRLVHYGEAILGSRQLGPFTILNRHTYVAHEVILNEQEFAVFQGRVRGEATGRQMTQRSVGSRIGRSERTVRRLEDKVWGKLFYSPEKYHQEPAKA